MALLRRMLSLVLPEQAKRLPDLQYSLSVLSRLGGQTERHCPICNFRGPFRAYGHPPRYDAECPQCRSLERHRLLALAMGRLNLVSDQLRVLHFAPESVISQVLKPRNITYVTADFEVGRADIVLNLEDIDLANATQDIVIANHVLEHVDDKRALAEISRILVPGGRLIASVPLIEGWDSTYENPTITSPAERDLHFGQYDHVRYFGRDFRDRLKAAGFAVHEFVGSGEEVVQFGLMRGERIFIATKPAN